MMPCDDTLTRYEELVYNNIITGLDEKNGNEAASIKRFQKKPKSMKCNNCAWSTIEARKHPNVIYTMRRIYIRHKHRWKPIGWYCNTCGSIVLDKLRKPSLGYFKPPDPTIRVIKIDYY